MSLENLQSQMKLQKSFLLNGNFITKKVASEIFNDAIFFWIDGYSFLLNFFSQRKINYFGRATDSAGKPTSQARVDVTKTIFVDEHSARVLEKRQE